MATSNFPQFSKEAIDQALAAAQNHANSRMPRGPATTLLDGSLKISAQCISLTVEGGRVCVNLPLGLGDHCLPIPAWVPNGTAAQACLQICTKWGIPCGVEVTVSVAGQQIVKEGFGCSC